MQDDRIPDNAADMDTSDSLTDAKKEAKKRARLMAEAVMLEFVEQDDGKMVLRPTNTDEPPFVSIEFSDKVKEMLGADAQYVGQQMIHAAIQSVMHRQLSQWHAHVYDEEPVHFS